MSFGSFNANQPQAKAEINVVPLVDVMLVLLVIFIITAPLLTHSVKIDLPKESNTPNITKPDHVELAIREDGTLFWNGELVPKESLAARFELEAKKDPQPELHIKADGTSQYKNVAHVMSVAQNAKLTKIGFVTDPTATQ
ncbi:MAG TPA: biopolymer transporter ExbD [Methylotenera sp.]|nr:biopolymer transporter ExbD [Methylotenera sp.]HPH05565.1 biopolymer transporter ExbD [Methylotenera sp.]HPN00021.1 biopolymer transporter ExbD [Methylotenera sp.]